ncbi:MAG: hypothetical protein KAX38_06515, partial [Candidatus Krumholzibacteria bacterium]|nr:hypothetical protein [Candidatus Krumholzibacteria bacterium]
THDLALQLRVGEKTNAIGFVIMAMYYIDAIFPEDGHDSIDTAPADLPGHDKRLALNADLSQHVGQVAIGMIHDRNHD